MRSLEEIYHNILETFDGLIFICNEKNQIEYANQNGIDLIGQDYNGKEFFQTIFIDGKATHSHCENLYEDLREGKPIKFDFQHANHHYYQVIITPMLDLGKISKHIIMFDITDQKQAQLVLEYQSQKHQLINEIYFSAAEAKDVDDLLIRILDELVKTKWFSRGVILLYDPITQKFTTQAKKNLPPQYEEFISQIKYSRETHTPLFKTEENIQLIDTIEAKPPINQGFESVILSNVRLHQEKNVGLLLLWRKQETPNTEREQDLLSEIGNQIGQVIQNMQFEMQLIDSVKEKDILLKEVHHRVKNNLQLILSLFNLQQRQTSNPEIIQIINDSKARIKTMSLIHETLYRSKDIARIDSSIYIRSLIENLKRSFQVKPGMVNINMTIEKIEMKMDLAIPIALTINELVSNTFKYAFPIKTENNKPYPNPSVEIVLQLHENEIYLRVQDNGIGLSESIDVETVNSLGLRLVKLLSRQVHARTKLDRSNGTLFEFYIPNEE